MDPANRAALERVRDLATDAAGELMAAADGAQPPALSRALDAMADAMAALSVALGDLANITEA